MGSSTHLNSFPLIVSEPCPGVVLLFPFLPGVFPVRSRFRRSRQRQNELFLTTWMFECKNDGFGQRSIFFAAERSFQ